MKIIDLLTKDQESNINNLIKSYGKHSEFEVSVFSNKETSNELLTLEKFNNLNSILSIVTQKNEAKYKQAPSRECHSKSHRKCGNHQH